MNSSYADTLQKAFSNIFESISSTIEGLVISNPILFYGAIFGYLIIVLLTIGIVRKYLSSDDTPPSPTNSKGRNKQRGGRGVFDPDYRISGWNQSRFAPKYSNTSITDITTILSAVISIPLFVISYLDRSIELVGFSIFIFALLFVLIGTTIRRREWDRIQRMLQRQESSIDINATRRRQFNKSLDLNNLTATDFEHEVAWLLNTLSQFKAVVVGGSGDSGIDIELYQNGKVVGIVQCKYYDPKRTLAPAHVRELAGAKQAVNVRVAHLFTSARCTANTRKVADEYGIKLFDGAQIIKMREQAKTRSQS